MSIEMNNYTVMMEEILNSGLNEVQEYVSKFNLGRIL
jgi:hypothetical protein